MKILSLLISLGFLGLLAFQFQITNSLPVTFAFLFTAYTAGCGFREYFNPMVAGMLFMASFIGFLSYLSAIVTDSGINSVLKFTLTKNNLNLWGFGSSALVNFWFMQIGFRKAKQPDYNKEFSNPIKSRI